MIGDREACWSLPRGTNALNYGVCDKWIFQRLSATELRSGHYIVLTRRETGGLRRSHAAGHVRALHLMDMPSRMDGVRSVAEMSSMLGGRIAGEMVRGSMAVLRAVCLRL